MTWVMIGEILVEKKERRVDDERDADTTRDAIDEEHEHEFVGDGGQRQRGARDEHTQIHRRPGADLIV